MKQNYQFNTNLLLDFCERRYGIIHGVNPILWKFAEQSVGWRCNNGTSRFSLEGSPRSDIRYHHQFTYTNSICGIKSTSVYI